MSKKHIIILYLITLIYCTSIYGENLPPKDNDSISEQRARFDLIINEQKKQMDAFNLASELETIDAMQDFISLYPTSMFLEMARSTIERLQYDEAADKNSIESFNFFLNNYPDSKYIEKAYYKRSKLINTIHEYNSLLDKYPKGKWRKSILYNRARLIDTVEEYNNILLNIYPNNESVIYYRDKSALNSAKTIGTKAAFEEFIKFYPNSAWIDQAKHFYKYGYNLD